METNDDLAPMTADAAAAPEPQAPESRPGRGGWVVPFIGGAGTTLVLLAAVGGGFLLGGGGRQLGDNDASASAAPSVSASASPAASATLQAVAVAEPASVPVELDGLNLVPYAPEQADGAIGEALPTLAGTSVAGGPLVIESDGRPMAVLVLAHWCPHCQAEVALLSDYLRVTGLPDDVQVVAVSTAYDATRGNYPAATWLGNAEWPVPTLVDDADSSALEALGIGAFPGLVLVDPNGDVLLRVTGGLNPTTFEQALDIARGEGP